MESLLESRVQYEPNLGPLVVPFTSERDGDIINTKYKIESTHTLFFHRKDTARVRVEEDIRTQIKQKWNYCGKTQKLILPLFLNANCS